MRRIRIFPYQMGLVFRKDQFIDALSTGKHWIRWNDQLITYDMSKEFVPLCELNILLKNSLLQERLQVIEVQDYQIALVFQEGNFLKVLEPGRHAFWKSIVNYRFQILDRDTYEVPASLNKRLLAEPALQPFILKVSIPANAVGLLMVDGELLQQLKAGVYHFWRNEKQVQVHTLDLRQQQVEISGQEILSKDKAAVRINFFVQYQITDPERAVLKNKDYERQFYLLIQLALREYVGTLSLDDLLLRREDIETFVLEHTQKGSKDLGVKVLQAGLRDIILPGDVRDIMNQVLMAQKQAQANTITRREETASTRSLLNTAKLLEENAMLLKLKEMEYVEKIAEKINSISLSGGAQVVEQLREIFIKTE